MNLVWLVLSSTAWAAVLTGAGLVLQRRAGLSGRQRQTLWRVAAVLTIAPWIVTAALAVTRAMAPQWQAPEWTVLAPEYSGAALVQLGAQAIQVAPGPNLPNLPLEEFVAIVLAAGWAVRAGTATRAAGLLRRVLRQTRPLLERRAIQSRDRWTRRLNLRLKPSLLSTASQMSPFTCGVRKPVICLPQGLAERLDDARLDFVLGHECVHVSRKDAIWQPLERAVADVLWFNPFAWRIRRELDLARELSCDEVVLGLTGDRRAYASTLVDVARMASGLPNGAPAVSILSNPNESSLRMRVQNIMSSSRHSIWLARAGFGALVLVGAPLALAQVSAPPAPPQPVGEHSLVRAEDGVVTATTSLSVSGVAKTGEAYTVSVSGPVPHEKDARCTGSIGGLAAVSVQPGQSVQSGTEIGRGKGEIGVSVHCTSSVTADAEPFATPDIPGVAQIDSRPVGPDGEVLAQFDGLVVEARQDGSIWRLVVQGSRDAAACTASMSGLAAADVNSGEQVKKGERLGRAGTNTQVSITCRGPQTAMIDAPAPPPVPQVGRGPQVPQAPTPPTPPAPPAPISGIAPVAPAAPVVPAAPAAPPAPPAIEWKASVVAGKGRITSGYGVRKHPVTGIPALHRGVDIAAPRLTPIRAPSDARVTFVGPKEGYGNVVEVAAPKGYVLRFGQLEQAEVASGDTLKAGDIVGLMGASGPNATGPHLHLEVYWNGEPVDPATTAGLVLLDRS